MSPTKMFSPNEIPLVWGDAGWQPNPITYPEGVPIFVYLETHHSRDDEFPPGHTAFQMVTDAYISLKACDSEFDESRNYVAGASPGECLGAYIDDYYDDPECWGVDYVEAKMREIMSIFIASTPEWSNLRPLSKCPGVHFLLIFGDWDESGLHEIRYGFTEQANPLSEDDLANLRMEIVLSAREELA
jgi:hypothetical protein